MRLPQRLTAPEAVGGLPHCLHGSWPVWATGPHLVRRSAAPDYQLGNWIVMPPPTSAPQVRRHLGLSVGARRVPSLTLPSGTQRHAARWGEGSTASLPCRFRVETLLLRCWPGLVSLRSGDGVQELRLANCPLPGFWEGTRR